MKRCQKRLEKTEAIAKKYWKRLQKTGKMHIYKYKNSLNIPPLSFVDDVAGASKCGQDSLVLNVKFLIE